MNRPQELEDLALAFVQETLSSAERAFVLQLAAENIDFRQLLSAELALQKAFRSLRRPLPSGLGQSVYWSIVANRDEMLYKKVLHCLVEAFMPAAAQPFLRLLQRSVFTNG